MATEQRDQPVGELVKQLSEQTSQLVRQEIRLAQAELREKGKHAGIGAGLFGGGGLLALCALGSLVAAGILALATAVEPWLAALIVAAALALVAGVMALIGRREVDRATPPAPEQAVESAKQDVDHVKGRASSA